MLEGRAADIELSKLDDVRNKKWTQQYICMTGFPANFYPHFRPLMLDVEGEMLVCHKALLEWYSLQDGVFRIRERGQKRIPGSQKYIEIEIPNRPSVSLMIFSLIFFLSNVWCIRFSILV